MLYHYGDHPDLIALAVRMMLRIAQDHPFIDGNKRAGFYSGLAFLLVNGVSVSFEDVVDPNGRLFKDAVTGDVTEASYAQWLRLTVLGTMVLAGGRASSPSE
jgi:death-on-curing protein